MKNRRKILLLIGLLLILGKTGMAQTYTPEDGWRDAQIFLKADKSAVAKKRMEWWREARFGMFIHWNPSSLSASEISWSKQFYQDSGEKLLDNPRPDPGFSGMKEHNEWLSWFKPPVPKEVYDNLHKSFYPGMFNADTIAEQAKKAGMKYIIMVSKHHDGFCMWDSQYTDFDVMNTPYKRDILGEMALAARKAGLKFGIYYSQRDWHHTDYNPERLHLYNAYMKNQIRELLTKYGEISVLFFDSGEWKTWELWEGDQLFKLAYELQPDIIINDRCGVPADYTTPEQKLGGFNNKRNWESCMTLTGFWSWHGFQTPVIPFEKCLEYLIYCAGGDGNLLMNVGPLPSGQIDPREADRLTKMGEWLKKNGESIYGTSGGPFLPDSNRVYTWKKDQVYVSVFKNKNSTIILPSIRHKVIKAMIPEGPVLQFTQSDSGIIINLPEQFTRDYVTVVQLSLDKILDENQIPFLLNK